MRCESCATRAARSSCAVSSTSSDRLRLLETESPRDRGAFFDARVSFRSIFSRWLSRSHPLLTTLSHLSPVGSRFPLPPLPPLPSFSFTSSYFFLFFFFLL